MGSTKVFFTTAIKSDDFLENTANLCLSPTRVIFGGKTFEHKNGRFKEKIYQSNIISRIIYVAIAIIFFVPSFVVGSTLKGLSLINSKTKDRSDEFSHYLMVKSLLDGIKDELSYEVLEKIFSCLSENDIESIGALYAIDGYSTKRKKASIDFGNLFNRLVNEFDTDRIIQLIDTISDKTYKNVIMQAIYRELQRGIYSRKLQRGIFSTKLHKKGCSSSSKAIAFKLIEFAKAIPDDLRDLRRYFSLSDVYHVLMNGEDKNLIAELANKAIEIADTINDESQRLKYLNDMFSGFLDGYKVLMPNHMNLAITLVNKLEKGIEKARAYEIILSELIEREDINRVKEIIFSFIKTDNHVFSWVKYEGSSPQYREDFDRKALCKLFVKKGKVDKLLKRVSWIKDAEYKVEWLLDIFESNERDDNTDVEAIYRAIATTYRMGNDIEQVNHLVNISEQMVKKDSPNRTLKDEGAASLLRKASKKVNKVDAPAKQVECYSKIIRAFLGKKDINGAKNVINISLGRINEVEDDPTKVLCLKLLCSVIEEIFVAYTEIEDRNAYTDLTTRILKELEKIGPEPHKLECYLYISSAFSKIGDAKSAVYIFNLLVNSLNDGIEFDKTSRFSIYSQLEKFLRLFLETRDVWFHDHLISLIKTINPKKLEARELNELTAKEPKKVGARGLREKVLKEQVRRKTRELKAKEPKKQKEEVLNEQAIRKAQELNELKERLLRMLSSVLSDEVKIILDAIIPYSKRIKKNLKTQDKERVNEDIKMVFDLINRGLINVERIQCETNKGRYLKLLCSTYREIFLVFWETKNIDKIEKIKENTLSIIERLTCKSQKLDCYWYVSDALLAIKELEQALFLFSKIVILLNGDKFKFTDTFKYIEFESNKLKKYFKFFISNEETFDRIITLVQEIKNSKIQRNWLDMCVSVIPTTN